MAAINDPKWSDGSIVLVQSIGNEPAVYWSDGSVLFDFEEVAVAGWNHKIYGVTPSKVNGIANPTKVMGV